MSAAFHTFKLVPTMVTQPSKENPSNVPPSTPRSSQPHQHVYHADSQPIPSPTNVPPTCPRMNPPPLPQPQPQHPRNMATPGREIRESSVLSSGGSARKPRQNLDEQDHILILKHCYEQRGHFKEGTKAQFWNGVGSAFQRDTGKILAQMSATVGRLVEARRRQIADWEAGSQQQKPVGELNELLDKWISFLKAEDSEAEAERMRQIITKKKIDDGKQDIKEVPIPPKDAIPGSSQGNQPREIPDVQEFHPTNIPQNPPLPRPYNGPFAPTEGSQFPPPPQQQQQQQQQQPQKQQQLPDVIMLNGNPIPPDVNGSRTQKRKRADEHPHPHPHPQPQPQPQAQPHHPPPHEYHPHPPHPPPHEYHPPPHDYRVPVDQHNQLSQHPQHPQHPHHDYRGPIDPQQQNWNPQHQPPPPPPPPPNHMQPVPQYPHQPQHVSPPMPPLQQPPQPIQHLPNTTYPIPIPPEQPRKVIVEGQLTKEDWKDIMTGAMTGAMASDIRLRALELKIEKIETLVSQNNKLLLQVVQSRSKDAGRNSEERGPVHLDPEFERDYLSGRYSKTPLPVP